MSAFAQGVLGRLGLLSIGAWTGFVGMIVHRHEVRLAGVSWPCGLVLVLIVTAVVVRACGQLQRVGSAWFALGWIAIVLAERAVGGPSYMVATDWVGWSFMLGSLAVAAWDVVRTPRVVG